MFKFVYYKLYGIIQKGDRLYIHPLQGVRGVRTFPKNTMWIYVQHENNQKTKIYSKDLLPVKIFTCTLKMLVHV